MAVVSGGTTLIDNGTLDAGVPSGNLTLLSTQTASSSATLDFTSGIDSTYDSYVFKFINIHPQTDNVSLQMNFSTDGGSNYNVTKTTTYFQAYHHESNGVSALNYVSDRDLAQSTSDQQIANGIGNDNDQCTSGTLQLFNPSSDTFVKHFMSRFNIYNEAQYSVDNYVAGYGNTTSSIDAVRFAMSSGNIDAGTIKMYGVG
jgi:hypothetical protein